MQVRDWDAASPSSSIPLGRGWRCATSNLSALDETRSLTGDDGERVSIHQVDVSDRAQMEAFAGDVLTQHGTVEILINNAGISMTPMLFDEITDAQFEKVIDINMWGVYHGIRAFLPHLRARPEASIVNISSFAGVVGLYKLFGVQYEQGCRPADYLKSCNVNWLAAMSLFCWCIPAA